MFAQKLKTYFDCLTTDRICALLILRYENRLVSFPDSGVEYAALFFFGLLLSTTEEVKRSTAVIYAFMCLFVCAHGWISINIWVT